MGEVGVSFPKIGVVEEVCSLLEIAAGLKGDVTAKRVASAVKGLEPNMSGIAVIAEVLGVLAESLDVSID